MTAISGQKCLGLYAKQGQLGSLVRMLLGSSTWNSTKCILTWKQKATKSSRLLFQLAVSMRRTGGTESGLSDVTKTTMWPTPRACDPEGGASKATNMGGGMVQGESKGRKVGSQVEGCCTFCGEVMANAEQSGRQGWVQGGANEKRKDFQGHSGCCCTARRESGEAVWPIEPRVGRLAHGIPDRVAKLKGLGNAIVPQVASEIIRCINQVMEDNK